MVNEPQTQQELASQHRLRTWGHFAQSEWWQSLRNARTSVLMLDCDGTLAPFVADRLSAKVYAGVAERLIRLAGVRGIRLAILSGRPAKEVLSLLPQKMKEMKVEISGGHGRERLLPNGCYETIPLSPAQGRYLDEFENLITSKGFPFVLERKVGSLALHTRGLDAVDAKRICKLAQSHYRSIALVDENAGLEWLRFDGGIEIRGTGRTKADAVLGILSDVPFGTPVAYLGDDQTDEDAFRVLRDRQSAASVLVRAQPRETAAKWWICPPTELLAFLDRYLDTQRERNNG
jgi:trehalose-phosphatase